MQFKVRSKVLMSTFLYTNRNIICFKVAEHSFAGGQQ